MFDFDLINLCGSLYSNNLTGVFVAEFLGSLALISLVYLVRNESAAQVVVRALELDSHELRRCQ